MTNQELKCTLLICEDDISILDMLTDYFSDLGAKIISTSDGGKALELIKSSRPDIVLLDVVLPNQDGISIVKDIRDNSLDVPVILMTEKSSIDDRVLGLDSGADDYLCKPFSPKELFARVKAQLRRLPASSDKTAKTLQFNTLRINPLTREVYNKSSLVIVTKTEFDVLYYLAKKHPEVIAHEELFSKVLGYNPGVETKALTMHVMNLRKKFRKHDIDDVEITAVPGVGYRFTTHSDA